MHQVPAASDGRLSQCPGSSSNSLTNITEILRTANVDDKVFSNAIDELERAVRSSGETMFPREAYFDIDTEIERKILMWLDQRTDLSRVHESKKQSRNVIAFKAWLLGSPEWKLFTKVEGEHAFSRFIKSRLTDWENQSEEQREITLLVIGKVFQFIINFIEIRLPNPFARPEIESIYHATLALTDFIQKGYTEPLKDEAGNRNIIRIRNNFINNYEAYVSVANWEHKVQPKELKARLQKANNLLNRHSDRQELTPGETMEDLRRDHAMTLTFRYSQFVSRVLDADEADKQEALEAMSKIFNHHYSERIYSDPLKIGRGLIRKRSSHSEEFYVRLESYTPHEIRTKLIPDAYAPDANQAELDAFANTFKAMPQERITPDLLERLLKNTLGNGLQDVKYHWMDNCQGYILLIIDEILRRFEAIENVHDKVDTGEVVAKINAYLIDLPHHPMHVDLVGSINIRLSNIASTLKTLGNADRWSQAEHLFVKGLKLLYAEENRMKLSTLINIGSSFLERYSDSWLARHADKPYSVYFKPASNENPDPQWKARAWFGLIMESPEFASYEDAVRRKADEAIVHVVREFRAKGRLNHLNVTDFLVEVADAISHSYDGMFSVTIGEKESFQWRIWDFLRSDEIHIWFGYYAHIEYPIESAAMVMRGLSLNKGGTQVHHWEIHKLLTENVASRLREFIRQSSDQELFAKMRSPDEIHDLSTAEDLVNWDRKKFTDSDNYARYRRLFLEQESGLEIEILHQMKYFNGEPQWSELLVRFKDWWAERQLPLDEVFRFLDLFGVYADFSRRILKHAFKNGVRLGRNFSVNVRWDEFHQEFWEQVPNAPWEKRKVSFAEFIEGELKLNLIAPNAVTLEILESNTLDLENVKTLENLRQLKKTGIRIAMDDFGSDYSFNDRYVKLRKFELLGQWDEVKFDAVYKDDLMKIAELTEDWDDAEWDIKKADGTLMETIIDRAKKAGAVNTVWFLNQILICSFDNIKCTIEQIELKDLSHIRIAVLLGLEIQWFAFHRPERISTLSPVWTPSAILATEETKYQVQQTLNLSAEPIR